MHAASLRVDPTHDGVLYINDISKDRKYQQFSPSLRAMLQMNMWGQMSFCRANVLTMIFVVDPSTELGQLALSYMIGVFQNGAPIHPVQCAMPA